MTTDVPNTMRQIRSLVTADGQLELSIATVETPQPQPHEVLVRIDAAPINPSDLGYSGDSRRSNGHIDWRRKQSVVTAPIPPHDGARPGIAQRPVDAGGQRRRRRRRRSGFVG